MAYDLPDVLESTSWMVPVKPLYLPNKHATEAGQIEACLARSIYAATRSLTAYVQINC